MPDTTSKKPTATRPIDYTYTLPFVFTGTIDHVTIALGQPAAVTPARQEAAVGVLAAKK